MSFSLSLYSVEAVLIVDNTGERLFAKYYAPPVEGQCGEHQSQLLHSVKLQKEFERELVEKTHKQDSEVLILGEHLVFYKEYIDVTLFLLGPINENEILLQQAFSAFRGSLDLVLQSGIDKKNIQEHYDIVLLAIDETVDNGIILETDSSTIASRITSTPTSEPQLSLDLDKGLLGAWDFAKSKLQERLQQGL